MLRLVAASFLIAGAAAWIGWSAPAPSNKKGPAPKASAPAKKKMAPATAARGRRPVGRRYARRRAPERSLYYGQQRPAPERIQEIEQALATKGFLASSPDTVWDEATTDALRRFQQSQNLNADGKLSSMSLIALGLGPRHLAAPPPPPPPPSSPPPPTNNNKELPPSP